MVRSSNIEQGTAVYTGGPALLLKVYLGHAVTVGVTDTRIATGLLSSVQSVPFLGQSTTSSSSSRRAVLDTFGGITPDNIPFIGTGSRTGSLA